MRNGAYIPTLTNAKPANEPSNPAGSSVSPDGGLIWVVDDSPLQLQHTRALLSKRHALECFETSEALLERLAHKAPPSLLLLDWELPGVSGVEACRFIREQFDESTLPILMLTGRDAHEDLALGLAAGANDYVAKPYDDAVLLARVKTLLRIRQSAQALREREAWLTTTLTSIGDAVISTDARGRITFLNPMAERLTGWRSVEVLGEPLERVFRLLDEQTREVVAGPVDAFLLGGIPPASKRPTLLIRRDGSERTIDELAAPIRDPSGALTGVVLVFRDVGDKRRSEAERERLAADVRGRERQLREVLESMGDGFFSLDPAFRITDVNGKFVEASGKPREETVGRALWDLFPRAATPGSQFDREYRRCMNERVEVHFVVHQPEEDAWTDIRAFPTADGGIAVFFRDVSAEQRQEAAAKKSAEFEQQLIGIVSHDLRNPLSAILMASTMLTRSDDLDDRATKNAVRIKNAAERATRLVNDLLDFTKARLGGGIRIDPAPADLHVLTRTVMDEVEAAWPGRDLQLRQDGITKGAWDPDRLGQVVQNLVTNALKYSPEGSTVQIVTGATETEASLSVHNTGAHIAEELLQTIFEPMRRGTEGIDRAARSVGLGLYIVKQIVEAHKGTVTVKSAPGAGTTFTVRLPLSRT